MSSNQVSKVIFQELQNKFLDFRAKNSAQSKVPLELQQDVLSAIQSGLKMCDVSKALKISANQIAGWRRRLSLKTAPKRNQEPRILNVSKDRVPAGLRVSYEDGRWELDISF